ncbi:hypothetical protein, partial [Marinobacter salarius]
QIKKISIHRGGGGLANFVVLANSKLTGFTAVSYFFTLTRDEPFLSPPCQYSVVPSNLAFLASLYN